jgi:hypothetical protein
MSAGRTFGSWIRRSAEVGGRPGICWSASVGSRAPVPAAFSSCGSETQRSPPSVCSPVASGLQRGRKVVTVTSGRVASMVASCVMAAGVLIAASWSARS